MDCAKCKLPIEWFGVGEHDGAWVVNDPETSADGLSYCPPDPDAVSIGDHRPTE